MNRSVNVFFLLIVVFGVSSCATSETKRTQEVSNVYDQLLRNKQFKKIYKRNMAPAIYPIPAIPRYYRYEMDRNLSNYREKKQEVYLKQFSYWFNRWKNTFSEEYKTTLDQLYGFAEYKVSRSHGEWKFRTNWSEDFNLPNEARTLGFKAGQILDELKVPQWVQKVKSGFSPLEVLSQKYPEQRASIDHKIQNKFFHSSLKIMEKIDPKGSMDFAIKYLANPKKAKFVYNIKDFKGFKGDKEYKLFFNFTDAKDVSFYFFSQEKNWPKHNLYVKAHQTPCAKGPAIIAIEKPDHGLSGPTPIRNTSLQKSPKKLKGQSGGWWYCFPEGQHWQINEE